ncbi:MAG: hypothetical protein PUE10_00120, partial [Bacteroidales bacterium]|nr:hypothetical protein [Bacteroidales bacterium]
KSYLCSEKWHNNWNIFLTYFSVSDIFYTYFTDVTQKYTFFLQTPPASANLFTRPAFDRALAGPKAAEPGPRGAGR